MMQVDVDRAGMRAERVAQGFDMTKRRRIERHRNVGVGDAVLR
jgi:hypothetical protein